MGDGVASGPIHRVTVGTFLMDVTEVTTADYAACVSTNNCTPPAASNAACNYGVADHGDQPINCVDWFQANAYCQSLGKRLPTEEEWEYAARGPEGREFPWGNGGLAANRLNLCGDECSGQMSTWGSDRYPQTAPVGSFPLGDTPEGLHDMAGNVWEWTSSPGCDYPSTPCTNCSANTTCANPCGACADSTRVHRGNGWADQWDWPQSLIFKVRGIGPPSGAVWYIGFRCAQSVGGAVADGGAALDQQARDGPVSDSSLAVDAAAGKTGVELGTFGPWAAIPAGVFRPGNPALTSAGLDTHVFALGTDARVYGDFKTSATTWRDYWSALAADGVAFAGPPAAAEIDKYNGGETGIFALAEIDIQGAFYVSLSNSDRTITIQNWTPVPFSLFRGQPAIAATPSAAAFGPRSTLFLAGLGIDHRIYVASNTMTNGVYIHNNWTSFEALPIVTFQTAPAIAWTCPLRPFEPVLMITGVGDDGRLYVDKFDGSTWSGWTALATGDFRTTKPLALATSCGKLKRETLLFGLGTDRRIYFSRDHGTGTFDPAFTPIGDQTFTDGPGATAENPDSSTVGFTVAARVTNGPVFAASASAQ